ncbi:hypothetical protein DOFOFD_08750 [Acetobacteraceae bacterium EV16P]|uniref:Uncharacterized protein n=1 Tax=Sorlinia euscelidii TaxID=3081148 RepID=A0ABU7U658_9PROT
MSGKSNAFIDGLRLQIAACRFRERKLEAPAFTRCAGCGFDNVHHSQHLILSDEKRAFPVQRLDEKGVKLAMAAARAGISRIVPSS